MNVFLGYAPIERDTRCEICKHHTFLVWSAASDGLNVLHTQIHFVIGIGGKFPYLAREQGIHWWTSAVTPPECLKSYKKIGGK